MSLMNTGVLHIEQPWSILSMLVRTQYRARVFDERGTCLAVVSEPDVSISALPLRLTQLSGNTPFHLLVTAPDGTGLLRLDKGPSLWRPSTQVSDAHGRALGSVRRDGGRRYDILDAGGRKVGRIDAQTRTFHDLHGRQVAGLQPRLPRKRDGERVGQEILQLAGDLVDPLRTLVVASAIALDVIRNLGTARQNALTLGS